MLELRLLLLVLYLSVLSASTSDPFVPIISRNHRSSKIFRYISARTFLSQENKTSTHIEHGHAAPHETSSLFLGDHPDSGSQSRHPTFMLDLDETCLFGNDGNDLGIALQCMGHTQELDKLYRLLINPALKPAYDAFRCLCRRETGNDSVEPRVVIYTARTSLISYASEFRPTPVALRQQPYTPKINRQSGALPHAASALPVPSARRPLTGPRHAGTGRHGTWQGSWFYQQAGRRRRGT